MSHTTVDPAILRHMLDDGEEIAVLDVREEGVYAHDGHLLLVSNVPLSHLETRLPALVPLRETRIVVCDGGEGLAERAARRIAGFGYTRVMVLAGGTPAWKAAGERLYTGVYVPSKAFGEYIHHQDHPPEVVPQDLAAWKADGRDLVIVDSRPLDEYTRKTIPGSIDCPSAELAYRIHDLVKSPDTTVVVNCGGRTRAIIGAQALINAGLPNRVYALKDGTQGWHLAGLGLEYGSTRQAPSPSAGGLAKAREAAGRVAARFGVRSIDRAGVEALRAGGRTVYLLDVRSLEEYAAGHLPGAVHAAGGQLVQATDTFMAVRHAAVVLADDHGVRATMTAAWLLQMGWKDVFVLPGAHEGEALERGPSTPPVLGLDAANPATIAPAALRAAIDAGTAAVADLDFSLAYREGHVPGAWHVVRARLDTQLAKIPAAGCVVLTSPDGVLARLAAAEAAALVSMPVKVLEGGTAAWRAAGLPLEAGDARMTGPADDMQYRALDRATDVEAAIREYLTWEVELLEAVEADPDFGFRRFPAA